MTRRPPRQADSHVLPEGGQPGPAWRLGAGRAGGVRVEVRQDTHPVLRSWGWAVGALLVLGPVFSSFVRGMSRCVLVWEMGARCAARAGAAAARWLLALGFALGCGSGNLPSLLFPLL